MSILELDDRDPSIIYSTGWAKAGSKLEHNSTTSWTAVAGSSARLSFQGTSIGIYGTISSSTRHSVAPISAYSVDGGIPTLFKGTQLDHIQYSQLFFQSPVLPAGQHELLIAHTIVSDPLFLDFVLIAQDATTVPTPTPTQINSIATTGSIPPASSSSSDLSSASSSSTTETTALPTTLEVATPTNVFVTITHIQNTTISAPVPASTASSAASTQGTMGSVGKTGKSNAGAVAGGVIAGVVALFFLVFGFIFWRRKRARRNSLIFTPSRMWKNQKLSSTSPPPSFSRATQSPLPGRGMAQVNPIPEPYSEARYPGGYPPNHPQQQLYATSNAGSSDNSSYGQQQQSSYAPSRAYAPPSQLMNSSPNDYGDYGRSGVPTNNPSYTRMYLD